VILLTLGIQLKINRKGIVKLLNMSWLTYSRGFASWSSLYVTAVFVSNLSVWSSSKSSIPILP
jgi:hypothetical protein